MDNLSFKQDSMFWEEAENLVISCLTEYKDISVQELYKYITKKNISISLPNFYKIISRMIERQMLVKVKGKLQLHAMYIHHLI